MESQQDPNCCSKYFPGSMSGPTAVAMTSFLDGDFIHIVGITRMAQLFLILVAFRGLFIIIHCCIIIYDFYIC